MRRWWWLCLGLVACGTSSPLRYGTYVGHGSDMLGGLADDAVSRLEHELPPEQFAIRLVDVEARESSVNAFGKAVLTALQQAGYRVRSSRESPGESSPADQHGVIWIPLGYAVDHLGQSGYVRLWLEVGDLWLGRLYEVVAGRPVAAGPWSRTEVSQ